MQNGITSDRPSTDLQRPRPHQRFPLRRNGRQDGAPRGDGENIALAKAMGSKRGYAPLPPDQYEWQFAAGEPPLYRLWSWFCQHTVDKNHKSPYARRNDGTPATLQDAAKELGLDLGHVSNLFKIGTQKGIWSRKNRHELHLNGDVTAAQVLEANKRRLDVVHSTLRPAELLIINGWSVGQRAKFHEVWLAAQLHHRAELAAAVAEKRSKHGQIDDNIRDAFRLPKKGFTPFESSQVIETPQLLLPFLESVHSTSVHAISRECTQGESTGENVSVPAGASLCVLESKEKSSLLSSSLCEQQAVRLIASELKVDDDAAQILLAKTQHVEPTITAAEVVELANMIDVLPKVSRVGLLYTAVPQKAKGATLDEARRRITARSELAKRVLPATGSTLDWWRQNVSEAIGLAAECLENPNADPSQHTFSAEELRTLVNDPAVGPADRDRAARILAAWEQRS